MAPTFSHGLATGQATRWEDMDLQFRMVVLFLFRLFAHLVFSQFVVNVFICIRGHRINPVLFLAGQAWDKTRAQELPAPVIFILSQYAAHYRLAAGLVSAAPFRL